MKMYRNSVNLFDVSGTDPDKGYVDQYYLSMNGDLIGVSATASITEYISVLPSTTYTQTNFYTATSDTRSICFYDTNKEFISAVSVKLVPTFTTPEDCAYLRISRTKTASDSMLNLGDTAIPFEPYNVVDWYGYTYKLRASGAWTPTSDKEYSGGAWV